MAQKKLCVVTHTFLPHVGGIERVVYEQTKRLQKRFDLVVLTHKNYTGKDYVYDGIPVHCYPAHNIGFRLGIPYPVPKITSLETFLNAVKSAELVHAHGHPYISSLIAAKAAKRYGKPYVLTQHNTFIKYNQPWSTVELLNDQFIGKRTLKDARKIIVVSKATRNYVLNLGADPDKVEVVYNGVDLDRFKPLNGEKEQVRRRLHIPEDCIAAITVRRLVYKNGIDTLLESARTAVRENPQLIFLIVGKGPDLNAVKARVMSWGMNKNLIVTGFVSDEELPSYYHAADFSILPSKSGEGLPLAALESMACGLPLLATDVGGINEILQPDYGCLIPPDSPKAMTQAV